MDAETRFTMALARLVHTKLLEDGSTFVDASEIDSIAEELQVPETLGGHVLRRLDSELLLEHEGAGLFRGSIHFALLYERQLDRSEHLRQNVIRREVLNGARGAYERGDRNGAKYQENAETFVNLPYGEAVSAARVLEALGLAGLNLTLGHMFYMQLTPDGYDLLRNERELALVLPITEAEDTESHELVASDALSGVIVSTEQLLRDRGWTGALRELALGDDQYHQEHWVDAVREYYRALESGLKHRLDEQDETYSSGAALRDLASHAARVGAIPTNYQAVFVFADSIRSPRSHGAGRAVTDVEVGMAEALLMGNLTRTLLLYLGHRPRPAAQLD